MNIVTEKYDPAALNSETLQNKFYKLAKEHFQITVSSDNNTINNIKKAVRFFSLELPAEIKEIFIQYADAPLFWIYESWLLVQIEEFMKFNLVRGTFGELHKSMKDNYTKWATTKLKSEKDYYATLSINFIERDINKHNFLKLILKAIIFSYQSSYYNPLRAIELLNSALEIVNSLRMNEQIKSETKYVIHLYSGFAHLKENDQEQASLSFKEALNVKPQGSTAKFYCALTELNRGHEDTAAYYLREILNYDIYRLSIAIKTNNTGMFSYFLRNAFIYNIFHEKDFIKAYNSIETILDECRIHKVDAFANYKKQLQVLKERKIEEYYDDEIRQTVAFSEKFLQTYLDSNNTLIFALYPELQNRSQWLIEAIVEAIQNKFFSQANEKLLIYDKVLNEESSAEQHLQKELENVKTRMRDNLSTSIQRVTENYEHEAIAIEEKIAQLPNLARYNPRTSMSHNTAYNIFIAFVIFFIGGVSGYSNRTVTDVSEFNSIFVHVLTSGSKWGAISFLVGLLISTILSGIVVLERMEVKSKLLHKLSHLKIEKDKYIAELKVSHIQREKIMVDSINSSIAMHKKRAAELRTQRETEEKQLREDAEAKIKAITDGLVKF